MKITTFAAICILAFCRCSAQSSENNTEVSVRNEMARILEDFPSQESIRRSDAIRFRNVKPSNEQERIEACRIGSLLLERLPALRKLVRVGSSIFDYPGLLAIGHIGYVRTSGSDDGKYQYQLFIGGVKAGVQSRQLFIDFNDKGIITEIKDGKYFSLD